MIYIQKLIINLLISLCLYLRGVSKYTKNEKNGSYGKGDKPKTLRKSTNYRLILFNS